LITVAVLVATVLAPAAPAVAAADDPSLAYSTYLGLGNYDEALAVAVDDAGATYVAGAAGPGSITTPSAWDGKVAGPADGSVAKFDAAGALVL
jgi:hypothetical protein